MSATHFISCSKARPAQRLQLENTSDLWLKEFYKG